jgi:hypothetical protein
VRVRYGIVLIILLNSLCLAGCKSDNRQAQPNNSTSQTQWVSPNKLQPGTLQHAQLNTAQMRRIKTLHQTFQEVDPSSFDQWVQDFKRDQDPEREIRLYEGMAEAYRSYCSGKNLTLSAKQDVYQVVLLRSGAPDKEVLPRLNLKTLTVEDAKEILKHYKMAPAPTEVSPNPGGNGG